MGDSSKARETHSYLHSNNYLDGYGEFNQVSHTLIITKLAGIVKDGKAPD